MKKYVVELVRDLSNPMPDRRRSDWNCRPEFKKGERFVVGEYEEKIGTIKYPVVHVGKANKVGAVSGGVDIGKLILDNSVKVEPKHVPEFIFVHDCIDCNQVLRVLVKAGRVTEEDFEYVHDALIEEDMEEEESDG